MILLLLYQSLCYFPFKPPVVEGTTDNWVLEVTDYVQDSVCVVMFIQPKSPRCKAHFQEFQKAANISQGMIKFVAIDIKSHPKVAHFYTIRAVPAFRIIHPKGVVDYKGDLSADGLIDSASKLIPKKALAVDSSWLPSDECPLSAIMLTNKKNIPPYWAAISSNLFNSEIRIGFSKSPAVMSLFGVTGSMSIVFVNKNIMSVYDGQLTYQSIYKAIQDFAENPQSHLANKSDITEITGFEEFEGSCHNTGKFCVLKVNSQEDTERYLEIAKENRNGPYKFHECDSKCPFDNMEKGYYIFHPKKNTAIKVDSISEVPNVLDRTLDGTAKFVSFTQLFGFDEEI